MRNNVKGFTEVSISYCSLVFILEVQRPVVERLRQVGTGGSVQDGEYYLQ